MTETKRVVVLGAGYAGSTIASKLDAAKHLDVTVVDRREQMVHKIGGLRAAADSAWSQAVLVPRTQLLRRGRVVNAGVERVKAGAVKLETGEELPFDYLVCATGATNRSPGEPGPEARTAAQMQAFFADSAKAIAAARNIVIVGGGVVGVELSGEIRAKAPEAKVTIIHSQPTFVDRASPPLHASFQKKIKAQMDKLGIKYILGDRAEVDPASFQGKPFRTDLASVRTASGVEVEADLVFLCVGARPNSQMYPAEWLAESGRIKVDPTLQVQGNPTVFAAGDLTDTPETKMAYSAVSAHAPVVIKNILALSRGQAAKATFKPGTKPFMLVPLGPKHGAFVNPIGTLGAFTTSKIKGKSLFLSMAWKVNNLPTPKPQN